jgi:DNA-binding NarL/FixJ family response regulator
LSKAVTLSFSEKFGEGRLPPPGPSVERLSDRELEIFQLIGSGMDTKAIATKLSISMKTVQAHCAKIKDKLELQSATELLREAVRWNEYNPR